MSDEADRPPHSSSPTNTPADDPAVVSTELDWIGKTVRLPGLTLAGRKRTGRCAATNVDPNTGCRDMQIRRFLEAEYGNEDFGIYLAAESAGRIAVGDRIELAD